MRLKPFARVAAWVAKQPAAELFTTSITEAEIFYGIELLTKGKRRDGLLLAAKRNRGSCAVRTSMFPIGAVKYASRTHQGETAACAATGLWSESDVKRKILSGCQGVCHPHQHSPN